MSKKILALVGRPNVGKSTLFNRFNGKKKAITHPQAGVTRDRKYSDVLINSFEFIVVDTPGLEEFETGELEHRMMEQTKQAIVEADLVCFIVDGRDSIMPMDQFFANFIRKHTKNHMLIVNKCEKPFAFSQEYYKLGMGDPIPISAEHGLGMNDLYDEIIEQSKTKPTLISPGVNEDDNIFDPIKADCIQIVITGRPNVGKSTFINSILDEERLLTGPEAGITRESIEIDWEYKNHKLKLIDTAGLRKRNAINEHLEKLSTSDAINSINFANTVILMIDAQNPLEQQDLNIANYTIDQGRSLIIVVNKWDLITDKIKFKEELNYKLEKNLPQIKGVPVVFISAINKQHIDKVIDECIKIYEIWNKRISTSKLNDWLRFVVDEHPLPLQKGGKRIKIKYMTQIKSRPPTFKLFSNNPDKITDTYQRYLINKLRENFGLLGVPIRFIFGKSDNPFV